MFVLRKPFHATENFIPKRHKWGKNNWYYQKKRKILKIFQNFFSKTKAISDYAKILTKFPVTTETKKTPYFAECPRRETTSYSFRISALPRVMRIPLRSRILHYEKVFRTTARNRVFMWKKCLDFPGMYGKLRIVERKHVIEKLVAFR